MMDGTVWREREGETASGRGERGEDGERRLKKKLAEREKTKASQASGVDGWMGGRCPLCACYRRQPPVLAPPSVGSRGPPCSWPMLHCARVTTRPCPHGAQAREPPDRSADPTARQPLLLFQSLPVSDQLRVSTQIKGRHVLARERTFKPSPSTSTLHSYLSPIPSLQHDQSHSRLVCT